MKKGMLAAALVLAAGLGLQGCYGSFALTETMLNWNGKATNNKFANEAIFLVACIVPVYQCSVAADALVLNTIEFWTGKNPLLSEVVEKGDRKIVMNWDPKARVMAMVIYGREGELGRVSIQPSADGDLQALTSDGRVFQTAMSGGKVVLVPSPDGGMEASLPGRARARKG